MSVCRHAKDVSCSWLFASFSQPLQAELTLLSQMTILSWFKERISDDMNLSVHRRLVFAMSNILSSECAMRGRKIESEHGLREQPRRRLSSPGSSPCGYIFSRSLRAQWKVGGMDWTSTYLYTCIEGSNMYSTEQCVDLIIVLFVLLYKQKTNGLKNWLLSYPGYFI